jgi:uncharacterized protein
LIKLTVEKIKLEITGLSPNSSQTGSFALFLSEEYATHPRRLPIIIGMFEAQAIAIQIENIEPNRPMTHDLFKSFADKFQFKVTEVMITSLREGIFYAKIKCTDGLKEVEIDSRPSDAIAIGLRFGVPIYTTEEVLQEAGITSSEIARAEGTDEDDDEIEIEVPKVSGGDSLKNMTMEALQSKLEEYISQEEYEKAAKVRDEMERRN